MLWKSGILWVSLNFIYLGSTFDYNQDPARANPLHKVTCDGPLPLFRYDTPPGDTTPATVQKLCAQAQYGGYLQGYNTGLYCSVRAMEFTNTPQPAVRRTRFFELRLDGSDLTEMKLR